MTVHETDDPHEGLHAGQALDRGEPRPLVDNAQFLVALTPEGREIERFTVVPPAKREAGRLTGEDVGRSIPYRFRFLPRPVVSGEHLWAYSNDPEFPNSPREVRRQKVLADGTTAQEPHDTTHDAIGNVAAGVDGTLYRALNGTVSALAEDSAILWETPWVELIECGQEACPSEYCQSMGCLGGAPHAYVAMGEDGTLYAPCDRCSGSEVRGVGAFDASSGALLDVPLVMVPRAIDALTMEIVLGEAAVYYVGVFPDSNEDDGLVGGLGEATPEGTRIYPAWPYFQTGVVVGTDGPVWFSGSPLALTVGGRSSVPVEDFAELGLASADLVLARPNLALLRFRSDSLSGATSDLVAIDLDGKLVWQYVGEPLATTPTVLPGDGVIYAVTETRQLVAIEAPVGGLAAGPWPMPGGNAGNTRRVTSQRD